MDKGLLKNLIKLALGAILVAAAWWIVKCGRVDLSFFTPSAARDYIRGFGKPAAAVYIFLYALNTVSILPPIGILSLSAGLIFGKVWGAVFLMAAALLGTSCTFFISRFLGRSLVEKLLRGKAKGLDEQLAKKGFVTVLFFRLVPLVPYEALNYVSGLSKIKFRHYFLATSLGIIPGVIISAFFGGALGDVKSLKGLFTFKFMAAALAIAAVICVPFIYRRIKKKKRV